MLGLALLVGVPAASGQPPATPPPPQATPAAAQPPPPAAPQPAEAPAADAIAPATLKIAGSAGVVFHQIVPAATADFETVMTRFFEAVAAVGDDAQKSQAAGWRVARAAEGAPGGVNALYLFLVDPVVADADYSGTFILEMIYKAFPADAPELHRKFAAAYAGPRHVLTLSPVPAAPVPPAVVPPAPK